MKPNAAFVLFALAAAVLAGCAGPESETRPTGTNVLPAKDIQAAMAGKVSFTGHVRPILEAKCVMCHNHRAQPVHMSLENHREAVRPGALGGFIVPGSPERSHFITRLGETHKGLVVMPVVGERLTAEECAILEKWIKEGASWPAGAAGTLHLER